MIDDFVNDCRIYIFRDAASLSDDALARAAVSDFPNISAAVTGKRSPKACRHSLAAALLLLFAARNSFGLTPEQAIVERTATGKPFFPGAPGCCFNLSHAAGAAVCITAPFPVGIDIESRRNVDASTMRRVCTQRELADIHSSPSPMLRFLQFWTLKESYVKATGDGMGFSLKNIEFTLLSDAVKASLPGSFYHVETGGLILSAAALISSGFFPELIETGLTDILPYLHSNNIDRYG